MIRTTFLALAALLCASCSSSSPANAPSGPKPLAEVNGRLITEEEVEKALGQPLNQLERQVYSMKRLRIEAIIADQLLTEEAARRGVGVSELLDAEVTAKVTLVTDSEIKAYCDKNPDECTPSAQADLQTLRDGIRRRLQDQKVAIRHGVFVESLKARAKVVMHLAPPSLIRAEVGAGMLPARGPAAAKVTIVEFSDFHCPFCRRAEPTLQQVLAKYPDTVRLLYRDFPLDQLHPEARKASEAARCAMTRASSGTSTTGS